ncbi:hypothetical protein EOL70_10860 [Leucothrix sargassi]|nr:hypothetical protein EOL70_10860 [Leucothrix sargassi]
MTKSLKFLSLGIVFIALLYVASSYFFAKQSRELVDDIILNWNDSSAKYLAEVELLSSEDTLFGSQKVLQVTPSLPYLYEQFGDFTVSIQMMTGPVLWGEQPSIGRSSWLITTDTDSQLVVLDDFSSALSWKLDLEQLKTTSLFINNLNAEGVFDLESQASGFKGHAENIDTCVNGHCYQLGQSDLSIDTQLGADGKEANSSAKITLNIEDAVLVGEKSTENKRLNVSSVASVWKNNDTLDADLEVSLVNTLSLDNEQATATLQMRQWLVEGVVDYLTILADSSHYQRQAEWALEEVETTEQQDFYRWLVDKAGSAARLSWTDIVLPMQKAESSQLLLKAELKKSIEQLAQVNLSAAASGQPDQVTLPLTGELRINSESLDDAMKRLLRRWASRGLLREYETAFESDLRVRGKQLLLNNGSVPWLRLRDELKRTVTDQ